jgi:hypothetical protein
MARGIIYILKNPIFKDNIVKIGKTKKGRLEQRISELSRQTGVPFPFVCHSAFEIDNYEEIERVIHKAYRSVSAQTDEANKRKEFFEVNPEKARGLISELASLHNGKEVFANDERVYSDIVRKEIIKEENKVIRTRTKFSEIGIEVGTELTFSRDESKKCKVIENNKVEYMGEQYSLTAITIKLMNKMGYRGNYNGYAYWKHDDEILWDLRKRQEENEKDDEL